MEFAPPPITLAVATHQALAEPITRTRTRPSPVLFTAVATDIHDAQPTRWPRSVAVRTLAAPSPPASWSASSQDGSVPDTCTVGHDQTAGNHEVR